MMRILSLGAGVQSTTLALMVAQGALEAIDCAIFADTQNEAESTYEHPFGNECEGMCGV